MDSDWGVMLTERELSYLAGYFDADGSVGVYKYKGYYDMRAAMWSESEASARRFQAAFGGLCSIYQNRRPNRAPMWMWQARAENARLAMELLVPYLGIKQAQAIAASRYPTGRLGKKSAANRERIEAITEVKAEIAATLKRLKNEYGTKSA